MKLSIVLVVLVMSTFFVACTSQTQTETLTTPVMMEKEAPEPVVKYFEIRYIEPFQQPPVMVVNEGDIVELNFMLRSPTYYMLDGYAEDYFKTGMARFVADKRGEFPVQCVGDKDTCPLKVMGYLVVQ